jgi:hypothetical protein
MDAKKENYVDTHYVKDHEFRTSYATGVFGGITPNGLIDANFYSERIPIPKRITFKVDAETGHILEETERDTKKGFVREVHCGVLIDVGLAKSMIQWLEERIKQIEDLPTEKNE